MATKLSALDLKLKVQGAGLLNEKFTGTGKESGKPFHIAKFTILGCTISFFVADQSTFDQLQEGHVYSISGDLVQENNNLRLDKPRFSKMEATL